VCPLQSVPCVVFGLGADQLVMSCRWQYLWFNGGGGGVLHLVCTALCYDSEEQGTFVGHAVVRRLVSLCVYAPWRHCCHQFPMLSWHACHANSARVAWSGHPVLPMNLCAASVLRLCRLGVYNHMLAKAEVLAAEVVVHTRPAWSVPRPVVRHPAGASAAPGYGGVAMIATPDIPGVTVAT
jgi:hypothetical protein